MKPLSVDVHNLKNFKPEERKKFKEAMREMVKVLNSREFYTRFMNLELEQTEGHSNPQIYVMLRSGADKFNKENDFDIDVHLTMYYSWKRTIGYTYPSTYFTWINRKFFRGFDASDVAGNVAHEYMHNLGFGHKSAKDHKSVPYAIGYLVRDMIDNGYDSTPMTSGGTGEPATVITRKNPENPVQKSYYRPWYKRAWSWIKRRF
jgi:hypothetical protein